MSSVSERDLNRFSKRTLEESVSEAKRLGRDEPDAICLAIVLAINRPDDFENTFGTGSIENLKILAFEAPIVGNRQSLVEFLLRSEESTLTSTDLLADDLPGLSWALSGGQSLEEQAEALKKDPGKFGDFRQSQTGLEALIPEVLANNLRARVKGQDAAIEAVVRRLALTRADLDLRPHRPDGVFMFVGPTGVGKTELAKALAAELMGDEESMIRLDMSEYSDDWAVSRLTGPMPGYSGSDRPGSWLTTRVIENPNSVVLLDEIEKASPVVWNAFLQAFDDGRLTDSRGEVADFSKTIIVMTSNLGADVFTRNPIGFLSEDEDPDSREEQESVDMTASLRKALPIELFNRIDHVVSFRALDLPDIQAIADHEIDRLIERLRERNLKLTIGDDAREHLAATGYNRQLGARHLHRNIESLLLEPLALKGLKSGTLAASVSGGSILIQEIETP